MQLECTNSRVEGRLQFQHHVDVAVSADVGIVLVGPLQVDVVRHPGGPTVGIQRSADLFMGALGRILRAMIRPPAQL